MSATSNFCTMAVIAGSLLASCQKPDHPEGGEQPSENNLIPLVDQSNLKWDSHNDYGGTPVQSYTPQIEGDIAAVRLAIEGRENTRELLVTIRKADNYGQPMGKILASTVVDIEVLKKPEIAWYEAKFSTPYRQKPGEKLCICLTPSTVKANGYGYFEYAYSFKNKYPHGKFNPRRRGRKIKDDDGKDLCFSVVVLAKEGQKAPKIERPEKQQANTPSSTALPPSSPKPNKTVSQKEFLRLCQFLRLKHIPLRGLENHRVSIWRFTRGEKYQEPLYDQVITEPVVDIYYGLDPNPKTNKHTLLLHGVRQNGGGGTRYSHNFGSIQHLKLDVNHLPIGKAVKIAQSVGPDKTRSFIWLKIDPVK